MSTTYLRCLAHPLTLPAGTYEEVISLRDNSQNAFLAVGYDATPAGSVKPTASLTAMTILSGILTVDVSLDNIQTSAAQCVVDL